MQACLMACQKLACCSAHQTLACSWQLECQKGCLLLLHCHQRARLVLLLVYQTAKLGQSLLILLRCWHRRTPRQLLGKQARQKVSLEQQQSQTQTTLLKPHCYRIAEHRMGCWNHQHCCWRRQTLM